MSDTSGWRLRGARVSLLLAILCTGADLGGSFYEHALIVPRWTASPPESFALIQPDRGGLSLVRFWIPMHAALTLALLAALTLSWRDRQVRNRVLTALACYALMRIWTFAYFIPEITAFIQTPPSAPSSPELAARAARWGQLSHGRTALMLLTATALLVAALRFQERDSRTIAG